MDYTIVVAEASVVGRRRLLLVEDSMTYAAFIEYVLSEYASAPWEVQHVMSLGSALAALQHRTPAMMIVDLGLPDMQGILTLKSLLSAAPGLPVVVITGENDPETQTTAIAIGAVGFETKTALGANADALVDLIESCWTQYMGEQELLRQSFIEDTHEHD